MTALVARNPQELDASRDALITWFDRKKIELAQELAETERRLEVAIRRNYAVSTNERKLNLIARRQVFYDKIQAALRAGYHVIPNFVMDVFAVRTDRKNAPNQQHSLVGDYYKPRDIRDIDVPARLLPEGAGAFVSNVAESETWTEGETDEKGKPRNRHFRMATGLNTVIDFPEDLATPELMEIVGDALDQRIFDEIGVARDGARNGDPILIGRILNPRRSAPAISFFIGWHFDPRSL